MQKLSRRQRELAFHVSEGLDNAQIASTLSLTLGSVGQLTYRLYCKLGIIGKSGSSRVKVARLVWDGSIHV